jgi:predicted Zn-dependent protease
MSLRRIQFIVSLLLVSLSGCSISEKEEIEMGRKLHVQFEKESGGIYPDTHVQQYVQSVGQTLARHAGRQNLEWKFAVVNAKDVNAFAVPGGYIYITRGLLFRLNNEAQLAGVLGHEAGHITHRHSVKQLERARTAKGASFVAGIVGGLFGFGYAGDITSLASSLALMSYSRGQEKESDFSGLQYMTQAGYSPRGMVQTMEILKAASGGSGALQFLSSHPDPGNRVGYLNEAIEKQYSHAAQTGQLGEANFKTHVLSRAPQGQQMTIDLSNPLDWCLTCRTDSRTTSGP